MPLISQISFSILVQQLKNSLPQLQNDCGNLDKLISTYKQINFLSFSLIKYDSWSHAFNHKQQQQ